METTIYHLLVNNNKGEKTAEGGGGLKRERDLLTFFPWKGRLIRKGAYLREGA